MLIALQRGLVHFNRDEDGRKVSRSPENGTRDEARHQLALQERDTQEPNTGLKLAGVLSMIFANVGHAHDIWSQSKPLLRAADQSDLFDGPSPCLFRRNGFSRNYCKIPLFKGPSTDFYESSEKSSFSKDYDFCINFLRLFIWSINFFRSFRCAAISLGSESWSAHLLWTGTESSTASFSRGKVNMDAC